MKYGLTEQEIDLIKGVFEKTPGVERVFIYGSRAKNTFKKASDVDLAVVFKVGAKNVLGRLKSELEDLQIIYEIDLTDEEDMQSGNFKLEYERTKQVFYRASKDSLIQSVSSSKKLAMKKIFLLLLCILGVSLFWFSSAPMEGSFLYGIFIIAMSIIALNKMEIGKIILILSPIITLPFFYISIIFLFLNIPILPQWINMIFSFGGYPLLILAFAGFYAYFLRDYWHWIDKKLRTLLLITFSILAVTALFKFSFFNYCYYGISVAEKGVTEAEINFCKMIGYYIPGDSGNEKRGFAMIPYILSLAPPLLIQFYLTLSYFWTRKK